MCDIEEKSFNLQNNNEQIKNPRKHKLYKYSSKEEAEEAHRRGMAKRYEAIKIQNFKNKLQSLIRGGKIQVDEVFEIIKMVKCN